MTLASDFFRLFAGLDRAYGTYKIPKGPVANGDKVAGKALTVYGPVTVELWEKHLAGEEGIGIVPIRDDGTVVWAAIDIDIYNIDHNELNVKLLKLDLPMIVCRTKSGGAHLYAFFDQPIPAPQVISKLKDWAVAIGHPGVEVFPKQGNLTSTKDVGNWINMPYLGGADTNRFAIYNGKKLSPSKFVELAGKFAITPAEFAGFQVQANEAFADGPPCLQHLAVAGFPRGTRNMAIFNMGVYARMKYGNDWESEVERLNTVAINPPLAGSEVAGTIKSLSRKSYFYTCNQAPIATCCNKAVCITRNFGIGNSTDAVAPVQLGQLSKIDSDPPIWITEVNGFRIECDAETMLNQTKFRKLCMEKANFLPPTMKQAVWDVLIRARLAEVETLEAPPDASPVGQFHEHLKSFLSRSSALQRDELLMGKPYWDTEDKMVWFRSTDLIKYLDQMHFRAYNEQQVWAKLREIGAAHKFLNLKGKGFNAWAIPQFDVQTEPHAPHDVTTLEM